VRDLEPTPQDQSLPATEFTACSIANPQKAAKKERRWTEKGNSKTNP
tara:strand:+ start:143 stop:283 length:141 start_codon:yes stop_codon:yes gene_type:complete